MTNPADTNQASEDKLDEILEDVYYSGYSDGKDSESGYGRAVDADSRHIAKSAIQSLIRTEKLKLLAEVRERVVGEPIPYGWDDDIDDMTKWKYYTGYKSNANDFVAGYNRSRAERLEHLTKLEAEL